MSNYIVACNQEMDIGCKVILWNDSKNGFSFYPTKKYAGRNVTLETLRQEVKTFILHHSVTYTAKQTYAVLISRGLSVNFIIDDNDQDGYATIYQCLDIKDAGYSHAPLNRRGPGVEISYRPLVSDMPEAYSEINQKKYKVQPHKITNDTIHGHTMKVFQPTPAQVKSITALLCGFVKLFPNVPKAFPKDKEGNIVKTSIVKPEKYEGFLAHYHVTRGKIDPLGLDLSCIEQKIIEC